jgi:lipopolysaccharide export system protein LptA
MALVLIAALTAGAVFGSPVGAVPAATPRAGGIAPPKCNQPINVSADRFLADLNGKTGTYTGNVLVTQCDMKMRSNNLRVNVTGKSNTPDKILASGNVVLDSPTSGVATGDSAVYDVTPRIVTMTGHVVLTKAKDVMRGTQMTVNLATGQASLGARPVSGAQGLPGGRVQGVFTPAEGTR